MEFFISYVNIKCLIENNFDDCFFINCLKVYNVVFFVTLGVLCVPLSKDQDPL